MLAAALLVEKGVGKGDRVALLSLNRSCFFIVLGALAKIGVIMVLLNWRLSSKDLNLNMLAIFQITGMNLALAVMQVGGRNIIIEKFNEKQLLELTTAEKVSLWGSFSPILSRTIEEFDKGEYNISSLKYVVGLDGPETIASF